METLSSTRASRFRSEGYLVVRDIISQAFVRRAREFLAQNVQVAIDELREQLELEAGADVVAGISERLRAGPPLADHPRHVAMGHFPLTTRLSPVFWQIAEERALLALLSEVIETEPLSLHLPPAARFVLPGNGFAGVPAHQDFRYNTHLPANFVTVWVPFVEIDDECGGVIVYDAPRGCELPLRSADGPWLGGVDTTGYTGHHITIGPGDVLLLDSTVLHASAPNRSNRVRLSTDFRFFSGRSGKTALRLCDLTVIHAEDNS